MNIQLGRSRSFVAMIPLLVVAGALICMTAGCDSDGTHALGVSPQSVTIGRNVATFTVAVVDGTRELSLPLEWSVVNPALGSIMHSSGLIAVYANTGEVGVNTITVRDQYGADGFAVITQVAYSTDQPPQPTVPETPTEPETPEPQVLPASEFPGQLSVAGGEPSVTGVTGTTEIFNIQRDTNGDTVSYYVTYDGKTYRYP